MIRTLSLIAALAALASPALAADVKISLIGKDSAAIRSEIVAAARFVCRDREMSDSFGRPRQECVAATIKETQAKISAAGRSDVLASNTLELR